MKTRDQAVFDAMFKRALALKYTAYDYKPDDGAAYPFVEFEDTTTAHQLNKTDVKGTVELVISVWGLQKQRRKVSDMVSNLYAEAMALTDAYGYPVMLNVNQSNVSMMDDTTTTVPLKRGRLRLVFTLL